MMKNSFKTAFSEHQRGISPSGSEIENTYGYEINKAGQKILTVNGKQNVYDKIQEFATETRIENILARAATGDNTVFRPDGIYGDMTTAPSSLIEARKMMQELENTWNGLSQELRNKYNNDLETFIGAAGQTEWLKDMGFLKNEMPKEIKEEIKTEAKEVAKDE